MSAVLGCRLRCRALRRRASVFESDAAIQQTVQTRAARRDAIDIFVDPCGTIKGNPISVATIGVHEEESAVLQS